MKKCTLCAWALCAGVAAQAQSPVSLNIADVATAKLGFQGQFQLQSNTDPVLQGTTDNFVVRRIRLFAGGTIGSDFDWLFDTDAPNTGKIGSSTNGQKNLNNMFVQDAVLTYKFCKGCFLDCGILTIDPNHNGLTSSGRYFGNDAFAYQGLQNTPLGNTASTALTGSSPLSREVGLSARGLIGDHVEYHVALTNGYRNSANNTVGVTGTTVPTAPVTAIAASAAPTSGTVAGNNAFRTTLRVQYDLFDNEGAGYTTAGTYFGTRKIVSFGLGYDRQDAYKQVTGDVFVDLPVAGGDVATFEGAYWRYDGGSFLPSLLKQKDWSAQVGYTFKRLRLSPILRYEAKRMDTPGYSALGTPVSAGSWTSSPGSFDEDRASVGVAYWLHDQRANLKVFYANIRPKNLVSAGGVDSGYRSYHQITAQLQLFAW